MTRQTSSAPKNVRQTTSTVRTRQLNQQPTIDCLLDYSRLVLQRAVYLTLVEITVQQLLLYNSRLPSQHYHFLTLQQSIFLIDTYTTRTVAASQLQQAGASRQASQSQLLASLLATSSQLASQQYFQLPGTHHHPLILLYQANQATAKYDISAASEGAR